MTDIRPVAARNDSYRNHLEYHSRFGVCFVRELHMLPDHHV